MTRIGQWEHCEKTAAAEHKPGFIAIPDGCNGIDHDVAVFLAMFDCEEDADAEIEAVKQHIGKHCESEERGPDDGKPVGHALPSGNWSRPLP
jgi:hypothetical protein